MAIRGIENAKETKRMAAELARFSDGFEDAKPPESVFSSPEQIHVSPQYLGYLAELAKGSEADVVTVITQTDKPIYAQLKRQTGEFEFERCGEALIAPRIEEGIRSRPLERVDPEPDITVYTVVDESYEHPVRTWLRRGLSAFRPMSKAFEEREKAEKARDAVEADNVAVYEIAARRLEEA